MKITLLAAAAALTLAALPAFAGEGNGPGHGAARPYAAGVVLGTTLPPNGNGQGEPEPVNSLPPGFGNGTVAFAQAQSVRRFLDAQARGAGAAYAAR